jgi:LmbE family N-acetylglucosaminyl deacetylase
MLIFASKPKQKCPVSLRQAAAWVAILSFAPFSVYPAFAQQTVPADPSETSPNGPSSIAIPLPENRGAAQLSQTLKQLNTWASLMDIVAHPDDEDGAMLTYESRAMGVRASLLTLTRGEGGQNAMSADDYDALGLIRTNELLAADEYYGAKQHWGTEADFGFSKTQEESFARWGHERVLCDTILAVRQERPLVLVSTFVGGITDGHGQHQVSGEVTQEAYLQAGDPKVCPEQIAGGLRPWTPLKVYARVPFAPVTEKGMFDYATGKWAPARFYNYVTKEWSTSAPKPDLSIPAGQYDAVIGRSYSQIARQGWGQQKSQNGGANPSLSGGDGDEYHRYAARVPVSAEEKTFFDGIPTGLSGLTSLLSSPAPAWLTDGLKAVEAQVSKAQRDYRPNTPETLAPTLKAGYEAAKALRDRLASSTLGENDKANLQAELDLKLDQFQSALAESLGLDMQAYTFRSAASASQGPFGGGLDETPRSAVPGQEIQVRVHTGSAFKEAKLTKVWLESSDGKDWKTQPSTSPQSDTTLKATVPADAQPTEPYFTRPSIEQPYYDLSQPSLRGRSFAPYPLAAWTEFDYEGVPIRMGEVVQTMQRELGRGGVLEPLVITPPIGVRVEPNAHILPLDGSPLPVRVTVHTEAAADGTVRLTLPTGWTASPAEAAFHRLQAGDSEPILFEVKPVSSAAQGDKAFLLQATAKSSGHTYTSGSRTVGYPGLRPYNLYRNAELKTRAIDVKLSPAAANHSLRIGYVMGTGDMVPDAIEGLGLTPHLLSSAELASADLSTYDVILIGIRAYSARPELTTAQSRLNSYVQNGGTLVVQYQSNNFPAPFPLSMGRTPERVVEEDTPVKLLEPENSLLTYPNKITAGDFNGWVEERGHSFLDSWDSAYTPLTETADAGQDPQRGGLLIAHPGKGTYIYVAYALYRQLPELVPGAYRLLANLVSAGQASSGSRPKL